MMRLSSIARAVVSISDTAYNHPTDVDWVRLQTNIRGMPSWNAGLYTGGLLVSLYNNPWNAYIFALLVHLSIYRSQYTIIQGMRLLVKLWCRYWSIGLYFCPAGVSIDSSVSVASIGLLVLSAIIQGVRLFLHCWCMYCFIGLDLQSSMGCVY